MCCGSRPHGLCIFSATGLLRLVGSFGSYLALEGRGLFWSGSISDVVAEALSSLAVKESIRRLVNWFQEHGEWS